MFRVVYAHALRVGEGPLCLSVGFPHRGLHGHKGHNRTGKPGAEKAVYQ